MPKINKENIRKLTIEGKEYYIYLKFPDGATKLQKQEFEKLASEYQKLLLLTENKQAKVEKLLKKNTRTSDEYKKTLNLQKEIKKNVKLLNLLSERDEKNFSLFYCSSLQSEKYDTDDDEDDVLDNYETDDETAEQDETEQHKPETPKLDKGKQKETDKDNEETNQKITKKEKEKELSPAAQEQIKSLELTFKPLSTTQPLNTLSQYVDLNAGTGSGGEVSKNTLKDLSDRDKEKISNQLTGLEKILFDKLANQAGRLQSSLPGAFFRHTWQTATGILPFVNTASNNVHEIVQDRAKKIIEQSFNVYEVAQIVQEYQNQNIQALQGLRTYMLEQENKTGELEADNADLMKKGENALQHHESEKSKLQNTINQLKTETDNIKKEKEELSEKVKELENDKEIITQNYNSEARKVVEYETIANEVNDRISRQAQLPDPNKVALKEKDEQIKIWKEQAEQLAEQNENQRSILAINAITLKSRAEELEKTSNTLAEWKEKNRELTRELNNTRIDYESQKETAERKTAELNKIEPERNQLIKDCLKINNDYNLLKTDNNQKISEISRWKESLEQVLAEKNTLQADKTRLLADCVDLEKKLDKEIKKKRFSQLGTIATEAVEWLPIPQKWQTGLKSGIQVVNAWAIVKDLPNWTYELFIGIFFLSFWYALIALLRKIHKIIFGKKAKQKVSNLEKALENVLFKNGTVSQSPKEPISIKEIPVITEPQPPINEVKTLPASPIAEKKPKRKVQKKKSPKPKKTEKPETPE